MVENVIKGIFSDFNLDIKTHCKYSPPPADDHEEAQPEKVLPAEDHPVPPVPIEEELLGNK